MEPSWAGGGSGFARKARAGADPGLGLGEEKHVSIDLMFDSGPGPAQEGAETAPGQDPVPSLGLALGEAPGIGLDPDPGLKTCSYYDAK